MQLRDATYAGVSFLLIAGTLWLVALRSTEKKPAIEHEIAVLDIPTDVEMDERASATSNAISDLKHNGLLATLDAGNVISNDNLPATGPQAHEDRSDEASLFAYERTKSRKFSPKWSDPDSSEVESRQKAATIAPSNKVSPPITEPVQQESHPIRLESNPTSDSEVEVANDGFKLTENKFYDPNKAKDDHLIAPGNQAKSEIETPSKEKPVVEKNENSIARSDVDSVLLRNPKGSAAKSVIPGIEPTLFASPKNKSRDPEKTASVITEANIGEATGEATGEGKVDQQAKSGEPQKSTDSTEEKKAEKDEQSEEFASGKTDDQTAEGSSLVLSPEIIWWKKTVRESIIKSQSTKPIQLESLLTNALVNSPTIIAISQEPLIEQQEIVRAESKFDPEAFMRTQFDSRNDPVGNTLTVGPGESFLKDNIWSGNAGVRKKLVSGGSLDVKQELGFKNSNSTFFQPQDQGTSTLSLNFSQPLLRGGGRLYNESRIFLAQSIANTSVERFHSELQDELLKVAEAYWKLYYFRCRLVQIRNNIERGEKVLKRLEDRARLDSIPSQIARARAAVQSRRSQVANAERDVRNAETNIRKLLATPDWASQYNVEMLPADHPSYDHISLPVESVVDMALEQRPEVKQALQRARSASIQLDISRNELLPELNMLLGSYVSALEGDSGVLPAFGNQFGNRPGYYAGFEFRLPYRNREASSVYRQRVLNVKKITAEVDVAVQSVVADAQVSLRQVNSAYETLGSTISAIQAARADLDYQQRRWESFAIIEGDFAEGQNPATLLDQLLESQQRLTNEELNFSRAEFDFKVAQYYLKKSMGTLLQTATLDQSANLNPTTAPVEAPVPYAN